MGNNLQVLPVGPFSKGVIENATPSEVAVGAVRAARGVALQGGNKVVAGPGTEVVMTFTDDQGTPAPVTSIRAIQPFNDHALVVGYSSVTQKVYLYRVATDFSGWYNAGGALQATSTAQPVGVIWPATGEAAVGAAPDVTIAEGLGTAFFATPNSLSPASLNYRLRSYTVAGGMADVTSNLDGTGAKPVYALGCFSYQEHLWIWGFGSDSDRYRPELLRFSGINFDPAASPDGLFDRQDSFTLGDRIRSKRERIVAAGLAGDAMVVAGTTLLALITGYGRESWYRRTLEKSYGIAGVKAGVSKGDTFFYWAPRAGPMRVSESGGVERLWPRVDGTSKAVPNASTVVAGYDDTTDQVLFVFDKGDGSGVRSVMGYDVVRDAWLGPDDDLGLAIACAGTVERVVDPSVVLPPPSPPSGVGVTAISTTSGTVQWTNGSPTAQIEISIRADANPTWGVGHLLPPGTTSYAETALNPGTSYRSRVRHYENGQYSAYAPDAGGDPGFLWTTNSSGGGGTPLAPPTSPAAVGGLKKLTGSWVNGSPSASTEVWFGDDPSTLALVATVAPGVASYVKTGVTPPGTYYMAFRHVSGSDHSAFTAVVSDEVF